MTKKIGELRVQLEKAGFVNRGGKRSHRNYLHPQGQRLTLSGQPGDDAKRYQEQGRGKRTAGHKEMKMTRRQIRIETARYPKFVEWSDEDECFIGRCPMLFDGGVHGSDESKTYKKLCAVAEEWVALLSSEDIALPKAGNDSRFTGKLLVRLEPSLHKRLTLQAKVRGESLNGFIARALTNANG